MPEATISIALNLHTGGIEPAIKLIRPSVFASHFRLGLNAKINEVLLLARVIMILLNRIASPRDTVTRLILLNLVAVSSFYCSSDAQAHIFDRGHIERSIDVIIRGTDVDIRYAIGLSDETMVDMLVKAEAIEKDEAAAFRALIDAMPKPDTDAQSTTDLPDLEPLEFQNRLLQRFVDEIGAGLSKQISLTANKESIEFRSQSISISPRQHVALEIRLRATLPSEDTIQLQLKDSNFLVTKEHVQKKTPDDANEFESTSKGKTAAKKKSTSDQSKNIAVGQVKPNEAVKSFTGNLRLACRARGRAILLNSSVAPVLARADAIEIGPLDQEDRAAAATISVKLAFAKGSPTPAKRADQ